MKKYLVFIGNHYYPAKFEDYVNTYDNLSDAKNCALNYLLESDGDWVQIILVCDDSTELIFDKSNNNNN